MQVEDYLAALSLNVHMGRAMVVGVDDHRANQTSFIPLALYRNLSRLGCVFLPVVDGSYFAIRLWGRRVASATVWLPECGDGRASLPGVSARRQSVRELLIPRCGTTRCMLVVQSLFVSCCEESTAFDL